MFFDINKVFGKGIYNGREGGVYLNPNNHPSASSTGKQDIFRLLTLLIFDNILICGTLDSFDFWAPYNLLHNFSKKI